MGSPRRCSRPGATGRRVELHEHAGQTWVPFMGPLGTRPVLERYLLAFLEGDDVRIGTQGMPDPLRWTPLHHHDGPRLVLLRPPHHPVAELHDPGAAAETATDIPPRRGDEGDRAGRDEASPACAARRAIKASGARADGGADLAHVAGWAIRGGRLGRHHVPRRAEGAAADRDPFGDASLS